MFDQISNAIKTILEANSLLQAVYDFETSKYEGIPFATLFPSSNANDYSSTTENRRVYSFVIRLFVERAGSNTDVQAEDQMRTLIDSVLDDLDKNWRLAAVTVPTGYTFLFMEAAPSSWGYVDAETELRVAEIAVKCHVSVDTTLIT